MHWPHHGFSHRAAGIGTRGVVASAHQLATLAGVTMMMRGGNAVDAAVATAATLSVVEPSSCGAAGVGSMVIAEPGTDEPLVLDFVGPAPAAATLDAFAEPGSKDDGIRAALVPGAVAGWLAAAERFGRLPRKDLLAPAIGYAQDGIPVSPYLHRYITRCAERLRRHPTTAAVFLPGGQPPQPGQILRQPLLADTLAAVAGQGHDAFYKGRIADAMVRFSAQNGGLLRDEDLHAYRPRWLRPLSTRVSGYTIHLPPPPGGAFQIPLVLKLLQGFDLAAMDPAGADYVHVLAEVFKLAVADRIHHARDADIAPLLADDRLAALRRTVDPRAARPVEGERFRPAAQARDRETTTHLVAMDAEGWAVACTQTLGSAFGGGIIHGPTGLLLNSLCHWFDDHPASPNVIAPGKHPEQPLAPSQVWQDGRPFILVGTPGTFGILQTTPQILLNLLLHRQGMQAAIEQPRFRVLSGRKLALEARFPEPTVQALRGRGHDIVPLAAWDRFVGGAHGAMIDRAWGSFFGGADPRRDGCALGW